MIQEIKVWFLIPKRIVEAAIAAMRGMVARGHQEASREDNEHRASDMRDDADQLAEDAEELRRNLKKGVAEDTRPPPPPQQKPDE
jgi:aminoglycoside phosphotransferase family enzyme